MSVLLLEDGAQLLQETGGRIVLVPEAAAEVDSGFLRRRSVKVDLSLLVSDLTVLSVGSVRVLTESRALVEGQALELALGEASAFGEGLSPSGASDPSVLLLGRVQVSADAEPAAAGLELVTELGEVQATTGVGAFARSAGVISAFAGTVAAAIGPDLAEEELDELLFLLDVA